MNSQPLVLANLTLLVHLVFIIFCVGGGLACLHNLKWSYIHLPALVWGAATEFFGIICQLTKLENFFLRRAGAAGYEGDFLEEYLIAVIYPDGLTRITQIWLGVSLVSVNLLVYLWVWRRWSLSRDRDRGL